MLVGECASRVSDELKTAEPQVSWREAASIRNRIVHASFSVDYGVIYEVARDHLPELISQVAHIITRLDRPSFED
ncbi:MAG: HepT-like ribonuclease domain-containing protein [Planctomycetota bacterium]